MPVFRHAAAGAALVLACAGALAGSAAADIRIEDPYALISTRLAKSGAAFMRIVNTDQHADRLIGVSTEVARKAELHTNVVDDSGVARMVHVKEGFAIPPEGTRVLKRGGDHVMLMGLTRRLEPGERIRLILLFEKAGEVAVELPVQLSAGGMKMKMKMKMDDQDG